MEIKKISEVLPPARQLDGEQIKKEDILDKEIVIKDWVLLPSSFGESEFPVIQAELEGKLITFTGGQAIKSKLTRIDKNALPIRAVVTAVKSKGGRIYYDLGDPSPKANFLKQLCPLCKSELHWDRTFNDLWCVSCGRTPDQARKDIIETYK